MSTQVHPFAYHRERWAEARRRLPRAGEEARGAALEHIRTRVHDAASKEGLDSAAVSVFWHQGRPRLHIADGPTADAEYGTLSTSPRAVVRNAASRADRSAADLYRARVRAGIGL